MAVLVLAAPSCAATQHASSSRSSVPSLRQHAASPSILALPSASAAPPQASLCTSQELSAAVLSKNGAAGTIYAAIRLANTSSASCTISGYPELTGFTETGSPVQLQANDADGPQSPFAIYGSFPLITILPPHSDGAFVIVYTDTPDGSAGCMQLARLAVAPPSGSGTLSLPFPATLCSTTISVSPVKAGLTFLSP